MTVEPFYDAEHEPGPGPFDDESTDDSQEFPPPSNPMKVARQLLIPWQHGEHFTLRHWRGSWMSWERSHWAEVDDREIRSLAYRRLENATYVHMTEDGPKVKNWAPSKRKISDLLEAQASIVHLTSTVDAPSWLETAIQPGRTTGPVIACRNGLLDVTGRNLIDHDPAFFTLVAVPFDYSASADAPKWREFLTQVWPEDPDRIAALQEWFGYVDRPGDLGG